MTYIIGPNIPHVNITHIIIKLQNTILTTKIHKYMENGKTFPSPTTNCKFDSSDLPVLQSPISDTTSPEVPCCAHVPVFNRSKRTLK